MQGHLVLLCCTLTWLLKHYTCLFENIYQISWLKHMIFFISLLFTTCFSCPFVLTHIHKTLQLQQGLRRRGSHVLKPQEQFRGSRSVLCATLIIPIFHYLAESLHIIKNSRKQPPSSNHRAKHFVLIQIPLRNLLSLHLRHVFGVVVCWSALFSASAIFV